MYHKVAAQPIFMTVKFSDMHAHVRSWFQWSKWRSCLMDYTTEDQRSVVRFSVGKWTKCKGYS
jgi:hypothetical protein